MDKLTLFLVRMLTLQCFLHWCSSDEDTLRWARTLESFKRWNTDYRFLKAKWDKGAFKLSFNGSKEDANITFIFRHKDNDILKPFRIHLANDPNYLLAVDDDRSGLVVKKFPDTIGDPTRRTDNYNFDQNRENITFFDNSSCYLHIIQSLVGTRKVIKSRKSGLVFLSGGTDFRALIRIKSTSSGK